jgi:hypothetical protein
MSERRRAVLVMPDAQIEPSLRDAERARQVHEVVAVLGNGAGWLAALACAGVISEEAALRITRWLAAVAAAGPAPDRAIYPLTDAAWRPDAGLRADLEAAIAAAGGAVRLSADLGAYAVLDGSPGGIDALIEALPAVRAGDRHYPLRLPSRGPGASPLVAGEADRLRDEVAAIDWRMPDMTLIDGRGVRHTPWSADPAALRDYTLAARLAETDDVASALHVALREQAPDVIVVAGRSGILGAVCGQLVVAEGYHAVRSRRSFVERQRRRPIVLSMRH